VRAVAMLIRRKREVITVAIVTAIVVGGAVGLALTITRPKATIDTSTGAPTFAPASVTTFNDSLSNSTLEAINREETPQAQAYRWLFHDNHPTWRWVEFARLFPRFALATLYQSTGGNTTWLNNSGWLDHDLHECFWERVKCRGVPPGANSDCEEVLILLRNISNSYGSITDIEGFDLSNNGLDGTLPNELSLLSASNVKVMLFDGNFLSGPIPTGLGDLSTLEELSLSRSKFTGTIPTELGALTNLQSLSMSNTTLSGRIPTEFGRLRQLGEARMNRNRLNGTFPTEMGLLQSLVTLELDRNLLTGTLPIELSNMTSLTSLSLFDNAFTGSIPSELGLLPELAALSLHGNQLSGSVPAQVCAMLLSANPSLNLTIDCDRVQCPCERACGCGAS
jgi:Leucine-rich repeat (LRR) protein